MRRIAVLFLIWLLVGGVSSASAHDPWYSDVQGHWAEDSIRILWEEEVSDGYLDGPSPGEISWFRPNQHISRGAYAMLAAKVFDLTPVMNPTPSFNDVTPAFTLYGTKPAYGWLEAGASKGIIAGFPDGSFRPDAELLRGHAFAILIRALGLEPYASTLTDGQIQMYLARFTDSHQVDPSVVHLIATAIQLRILRGYPDGTLRLENSMNRAEAATIMRRSCLFRLTGPLEPFFPDGDGFDEEALVKTRVLKNRNAASWQLSVTDSRGVDIIAAQGYGQPPGEVTWDGRDSEGRRVPPATYFAQGWLEDEEGNRFDAVPVPLILAERTLVGYLAPSQAEPGDNIQVLAQTTGWPLSVRIISPMTWGLEAIHDTASYTNLWTKTAPLPALPPGQASLLLEADFGPVSRIVELVLEVQGSTGLQGWLVPDRVPAGATITIHARTWGAAERLTALGEHVDTDLVYREDSMWEGSFQVPLEAAPGDYWLDLTAVWPETTHQQQLYYSVEDSLRHQVEFRLSD